MSALRSVRYPVPSKTQHTVIIDFPRKPVRRIPVRELYHQGLNAAPVRVLTFNIPAAESQIHLSAARKMNDGSGFVRGAGGDPRYIRPNGEVITDPTQMRSDCLGFDEHIENIFQTARREVLAAVTFGDLMTNEEYLAWMTEGAHRLLFCRRSEKDRIKRGYLYHALGVRKDERPWAGCVRFVERLDGFRVLAEGGEDLTDQMRLIITGPPLVWDGKVLEETASRWSADLRHVLTMASCPLPSGGTILLGENLLMRDSEQLQAAARGDLVALPLMEPTSEEPSPLPEKSIEAFTANAIARGYSQCEPGAVKEVGQFALQDHQVLIRFKPGLYPHNALGLDASLSSWINLQVEGISTKSGCTLEECAQRMKEAGAAYAIDLDQGADPQLEALMAPHTYFKKSSFIHRARVAAALVWTSRE